jgi:hypothetical protein
MILTYDYPVVYLYDDDYNDSEVLIQRAEIKPIQLDRQPYEAVVNANGFSFHIIFGKQCNGHYLCIPNWHTGCELAELNDVSWNLHSLIHNEESLSYEDSTAVVYALRELSCYISTE